MVEKRELMMLSFLLCAAMAVQSLLLYVKLAGHRACFLMRMQEDGAELESA